jgi:hypothetical protein
MLQAMQQPAETRAAGDRSSQPGRESTPLPGAPSFAGLLASLASRSKEPPSRWNDDGLEDDVATLSYERALRTHPRYGSTGATGQSLTQTVDQGPIRPEDTFPAESREIPQPTARPNAYRQAPAIPDIQPNRLPATPLKRSLERNLDRNLMDASITIRMNKAECAQLHRRAAEAGLTVSAYLRSCTVEAESLRTMVKETLAQLRSAPAKPANQAPSQRARLGKLARILTPWRDGPPGVRV